MATVTFILKDSQLKSETPILSILRFDKERVKFSTGLKINPIHWNKDKRRAKQTNKFPSYPEFNQRLDQIKSELEDLSLKHLDPDAFYKIKEFLPQKKKEREIIIDNTKKKFVVSPLPQPISNTELTDVKSTLFKIF